MARKPRRSLFSPDEVATVHISNRCVRGQYLMGLDEATGEDHSERREWFQTYMQFCAGHFAFDVLDQAIMENHFHVLGRARPDVVLCWSDAEVARRWLTLCPPSSGKRKGKNKDRAPLPTGPTKAQIRALTRQPEFIAQLRKRLSDISWFIRKICQHVAQRANAQAKAANKPTGSFWNGRFHGVRLLDEEAVLACSVYINLNPIRAVMAYTFEDSQYTSIQRRLQDLLMVMPADENKAIPEAVSDPGTEPVSGSSAAQPLAGDSLLDDHLGNDHLGSDTKVQPLEVAASNRREASPPQDLLASILSTDAATPDRRRSLVAVMADHLLQIGSAMAYEPEEGEEESPEMAELRKLPTEPWRPSGYLAPLEINEALDPIGPRLSRSSQRCSDRGYLTMTIGKYIELLEWCARQIRPGKRGVMPSDTPPILERLGIPPEVWMKLVTSFNELFSTVAGMPESVDAHSTSRNERFYMPKATREMLTIQPLASQPTEPAAPEQAADMSSSSA